MCCQNVFYFQRENYIKGITWESASTNSSNPKSKNKDETLHTLDSHSWILWLLEHILLNESLSSYWRAVSRTHRGQVTLQYGLPHISLPRLQFRSSSPKGLKRRMDLFFMLKGTNGLRGRVQRRGTAPTPQHCLQHNCAMHCNAYCGKKCIADCAIKETIDLNFNQQKNTKIKHEELPCVHNNYIH